VQGHGQDGAARTPGKNKTAPLEYDGLLFVLRGKRQRASDRSQAIEDRSSSDSFARATRTAAPQALAV